MNTNKDIEFLSKIIDRKLQKKRISGINIYVLSTGIILLISNIFYSLPTIEFNKGCVFYLDLICLVYSILYMILIMYILYMKSVNDNEVGYKSKSAKASPFYSLLITLNDFFIVLIMAYILFFGSVRWYHIAFLSFNSINIVTHVYSFVKSFRKSEVLNIQLRATSDPGARKSYYIVLIPLFFMFGFIFYSISNHYDHNILMNLESLNFIKLFGTILLVFLLLAFIASNRATDKSIELFESMEFEYHVGKMSQEDLRSQLLNFYEVKYHSDFIAEDKLEVSSFVESAREKLNVIKELESNLNSEKLIKSIEFKSMILEYNSKLESLNSEIMDYTHKRAEKLTQLKKLSRSKSKSDSFYNFAINLKVNGNPIDELNKEIHELKIKI